MVWKLYAAFALAAGLTAYLTGLGIGWSVVVALLAPLVPRFLLGLFSGAATPSPREDPASMAMSGTEFEDYVARIARSCGVPVIMTSMTGDWGVDLIVGRRPHRVAVQCKRLSRPVGAAAVQEVVAGAPMQDCTRTMVVTNHEFTPAARTLAERHGCELVAGADLPRLRSIIRRLTAP
ncbi:restriction endonuclease [Mycobacterium sp. SMC-4]|uniref:restriction endonuclease n=1 Tax=Mycobacterium sp. SMC-4 TaxID=2857059 RepID=UPI0021B3D67C|nr:restriction endonuclease [Mycobacterium sp. SMC-4]UXA19263.1 restriction endonuclease [Mycobacterium sp. SMC-4]